MWSFSIQMLGFMLLLLQQKIACRSSFVCCCPCCFSISKMSLLVAGWGPHCISSANRDTILLCASARVVEVARREKLSRSSLVLVIHSFFKYDISCRQALTWTTFSKCPQQGSKPSNELYVLQSNRRLWKNANSQNSSSKNSKLLDPWNKMSSWNAVVLLFGVF